MDPIRPVAAAAPNAGLDALQRNSAPVSGSETESQVLDPAVSVELSPSAAKERSDSEARAFVRDDDSQKVVYRITDAVSGDVIVQIPNEVIIKARAYGRQPDPPVGDRVVRSV